MAKAAQAAMRTEPSVTDTLNHSTDQEEKQCVRID